MILEKKLAMVGYLNTKPFEYGMIATGLDKKITKYLETPSRCFDLFAKDKVDISLSPIGALIDLDKKSYKVITDYCIGCNGEVRTVCLFSNVPIDEIHTIYLDKHSRTSVLLLKVLMKYYYKKSINYVDGIEPVLNNLVDGVGVLLIGDKVFDYEKSYTHSIDLGSKWKEFTGLEFPFAVWICKNNVEDSLIKELNKALGYGVNHINKVIEIESKINNLDLKDYFGKNISYTFNDNKRQALELFSEYVENL
jgi:chorismate dehydratase